MAPVLGYWDIRGLAGSIRLLLECAGVKYDEKRYHCGPPPEFDKSEWLKDKQALGLDFPNLPYYIDGEVKLTQSHPIMRYLAKKHGFSGKTDVDQARADMLAAQVYDYIMDGGRVCYNPDFLKLKDDYVKGLPDKLNALTNFIGNNKFAVGDYVTFVDFILFEYLENQLCLVPSLLKDHPVLDQYHKRVLALEGVDKYFKSPKAIKYPFNGAPAYYGGAYSDQLQKQ